MLSKFLGTTRGEIIRDYVPKPVYANVRPPIPAPGQPTFAGMDPRVIKDPVARAKYEEAIEENYRNAAMNQRQRVLLETERELSKRIVNYMKRVAATDRTADTIIRQAIIDAKLTDKEKAEVWP